MTSFIFTICGNSIYIDARSNSPQATTDWYNILRGLATRTGSPFIDPSTGNVTRYLVSGDPVTGKGWVSPSYDCTFTLSSGPFTFAAGDTQEVVVAATIAMGADRISSVTALKSAASQLRSSYRQILAESPPPVVPTSFSLSQNYPNPFNPSTTIRFELAQRSAVKLKVFNVLGQLVATLVDEQKNAGFYLVDWNAQGAPSGMYLYQLQASDASKGSTRSFVQTKKMILMK
jgi:hypothetical protein